MSRGAALQRLSHTEDSLRALEAAIPLDALRRFEPLFERPVLEEEDVTHLLPTFAWAYLEMGDEAQAQALSAAAIRRSVDDHDVIVLSDAQRVSAMLAARRSRWDEARQAFEEVISLTQVVHYPYAEARALYEYGLMCGRRDAAAGARDHLTQALSIFERLGARPYVEQTRLALMGIQV